MLVRKFAEDQMKRKRFPKTIETQVLLGTRRRCALCFGLDGDTTEKEGQVAHIDRNAQNNALDNAAWLCTKHHSRYDSRSRQAKGHTPEELNAYKSMLIEYLASPTTWPDAGASRTRGPGVSLDVFDRRVPTYRATLDFLRIAASGNSLELQPILKFARDTDEALFLFDDHVADYLADLFKRALRFRAVRLIISSPEKREPELVQEETEHFLWFTEQFHVARKTFAPYLRVRSSL